MALSQGSVGERVLLAVARSPEGLTIDEASEQLGLAPNQISGRFTALVSKGVLEKTGRKRPTRTGAMARVYVVSDAKPEWASQEDAFKALLKITVQLLEQVPKPVAAKYARTVKKIVEATDG
jgi:predicted ArsR family transcriptional regulator